MTTETWAAAFLIAAPLWFNLTFAMLVKRFGYPDILRRPTDEILERFRAGGPSLILLWWTFMLSGLLMIVATVLLGQVLGFAGVVPVATTIGVLAGVVQGTLACASTCGRRPRPDAAGGERGDLSREPSVSRRGPRRARGLSSDRVVDDPCRGRHRARHHPPRVARPAGDGDRRRTGGGLDGVPGPRRGARMGHCGAAIPVLYIACSIWLLGLGIALIV